MLEEKKPRGPQQQAPADAGQPKTSRTHGSIGNSAASKINPAQRLSLLSERCAPSSGLGGLASPLLGGLPGSSLLIGQQAASLRLAQLKAQLALTQINNALAVGRRATTFKANSKTPASYIPATPPSPTAAAINLLNLLKIANTMSHHLYNPFASENKSSTQGQYGVHSRQAEIDPRMGSSRLGPGSSFSSPGTSSAIPDNSGGMFSSPMSQSMNYRPEQSRAIFDEKTERSSDMHMSRVRDEMRLPGQPIHRSIDEGTRFTGSQRDEFRSSGTGMASYQFSSTSASQGHRNSDTECSRSSLDWLLQRQRSTADDSMHYSSSEPDRQSIPGLGDYDHPVPDKHAAHTESSQPKYTTEAATNILLSLGFEKEDLEHLISYPDDQITPANLPFILRQIRIQKAKRTAVEGHSRPYPEPQPTRSVTGMDSHSVSSSGVAGMRQGETSSAVLQPRKVIDYGHVGKYTGMAGDEIGQTRDSRLNSSGSGSMQLMDSYNTSRLSREPLQRSPTEVKSSALGSSRQQTGSVPSSSSSYSSILKSVAPPSYDQTKRLPATPNQTSQTILSSFSLPKKDTDMRVFTSEASKPLPSKEPEADRQSTSKTQPLSTLFQHVLPRRPGSLLTGSNDNSDTKVQSKAPSQESRVAEQMKKQQMKKQQVQKQPVQQKQEVDRQSKQQKQQAQKQSVSQAGQALWPSVFPVSKSVPSTAVIPAITDTSRNTQHSTFIPGDLRGISTVPAKPQPIPSPIGLKHTTAPTSTRPPPAKVAVSKSLPTLAMMHDYAAASPRIFPHTCSLCNKECTQMKDWISHQNSSLHLESCTRLRKQYPDWDGAIAVVPRATGKNAKPPAATSAQTFQHRHQKVRHGSRSRSRSSSRSLSRSSSSSPHRHHGSDGRKGRRSVGSPQSSRYTRRSRSHSPWYDRPTFHCRSRSRSPERRPSPRRRDDTWSSPKRSYERQSSPKGSHETRLSPRYDKRRSSPRRVEEPPRRFDERRSPQRRYDERQRQPRRVDERLSPSKRLDKRRSPPRRIEERCSSPKRIDRKKSAPKRSHESQSFPERSSDQSKKSSSAERLARRILEKTDVQTLSAQSDLEAMAKTLAPVILAELNKIKSSSSSSSSSTTKKKLPAKRSKAKPSLQRRETDKASPPTMVKLDGIHDALSYNDVVSAAKQFGKTWSVVLSRSKQQAVVVYEKEEDAKKLKSLRSLDVNGVAVTVVTEKVSDVQKKPPQKKPVTATTTSTGTKKALLPTPNIPPLFPTPLLSGAMTAIPPLLSSSKPSPRPLHSAALKAVTIKPTSQEVAAKGSVKAPAAVTASKVLVSKAKNISSKQIAKTTEARKLPVKGAAKKAVAKKEMSSGSKSVAPKNQPDVGTSSVKKSKVVLKETAENRGTSKKTNVEAQQRAKLGKANDAQGAAPMQLGETGVETAESTQVEDCANGKGKKPTTTDAVPENSSEKPSKGLLTTSAVETLPTETKMTQNDPVTAVKTQSDETSAMEASTPTEPAAAAACEQQPAVTTASSAAVPPLTIAETQQHLPMEVESCADGKEGKPTTTDVVLEDSADAPSESQTTTSESLQTGADRVKEDSATPEKMQSDETSAMEASAPTEPAAAAACEQQPAVTTASSAAVPPLTIAETQQHLPMEVESCADGKEGKPTTTDVVLEDSADRPSESQTTTSETLQTGADRVQEDSAEKMQSDETSAMEASTPTEPAAAASTSSETAVPPLTIGETIEEHLHLDMIPSFNQRVLSQPNFYQLRGQQVLITGLPTYDDGCYTEEDVANLLMPFGFKYKCDKLYVVPQMCVAFVQMPTEVDESNIKSPNDQKPLFLKGSKLSFHLLSCDFEMTPSGLYKSLMDLVKSPVVERGPTTVFIDNIAPGDAGVLNKTLKEMYSLSNYLPLLNKVFIEFETVGDAERFENWYDGVKKDFGHKVLRLKIPSSSRASPIPQTAEENQTDGDSAKDEAVTPEPEAAAASEQEAAESTTSTASVMATTSTASVMATTSTTTVPDEYLSFDEMIEKYLNPNAIECIDRENNNDQKLLLITGLPAYYDGSYKEDNISKLLIPLGFQHRYDNIYIVPQSRLAFVKMPTVEAVNKIMDVKGKNGIGFKGSTIRFHVVSNMNAETPGNFYDSVMKLMKLPGVDDVNKIVVVSNISQSEFVTLREALKDVYSVRRYLPLLNKVFIQFDTVSEVDEFDAWYCGVKYAYGHEVHMEKKSQQQPAVSTPSTPSTPSTATVTPLTIGEMVEKHLDPLKIKCFDDMDRKALTQDNKLLLITGLPEFSDGSYTEDNITKLLIPLGFKHQYDNIYIVPEFRLAFVKMPSAKILRNLMEVKGKNGIFFKGSKIRFQVVFNFSAETPLDFYKSLMKLMKTPVIGDGRNIVIINNMSPGDTKDLRGALKNFGAIRNYLPLLNKVFIEFVSIHDPDRFAPWYNLHKKALKSSVYRMRIQSRTSTSQNPVDPAVTSQTDATDKPQTDAAVKTESDAAATSQTDAAVTSQTDAAVTSRIDAAVTSQADAAVTSEADAPATSQTDAAATSQTDAAATSQTDAAATSQTDAAATSQTDAAATSQTDAAVTSPVTSQTDAAVTSPVTSQTDAPVTSQTDAAVTSQTDAAVTSQTDAAVTSQTDAAATSQKEAAVTSQTDTAVTSQKEAAVTSQKEAAATSQTDAAVKTKTDTAVTSQTESAPAVISSTGWDMSEKLLDPKKIPCLKHMSLSSLKSLHRVPLLITGLPEFYDGCYTEADVAKLFIPFGFNYSPKSCPNIFVVPQSRWALVQMSRDTASTMHLATKKKQLVLKGCKLSVSLTVCGVKMLPLKIFQFLMELMDVPLDEANGFKMVMVSNLPQVYVKDLRKALKKSGSVRSFLPLLNKVFIEFESLDDVGHFETWFRSFKTGSGPQVIRLKRVVSDKDSSDRAKPVAAAASTSATSGKMGEKHKPHDRIVSFNSENYTPTKADSVSSHITITRHFDEQNFNENASPEPHSSSSSSRERTGRRSSGVSSAGKQIPNVRKSSSSSKLSHKTSSSSGQKTNSRVKTSSGRNTRSSSAGHEKENIKSASSLELSIETHLRKLREEAEAGGASLKVQEEWSEDDFDECTEEVDGEIYQILDSLDDQTDEPMESENQDGSVENPTSGSEEYETFYEEDFQVLDCIDDDGKAYSEEDSEMEMDCSFQVLDSVTEDLPVSEPDNSDDKDGEMKEDHFQGKCGQSDKGDRKTQEEASKDVEQPEDHPLQVDQDKHDDETETFEILDSVGDQTATEEGDQKLETPSKQICEDINATEEQEEAFQIVDSVEDQPTATENKSDPDNKGRRSKRGVATSRKDGGPSRRSGRLTTASKTEEKEKSPKKQDRTTRGMDSKNDEVVSEEMVYEVVDSVGDEPVEDSATTESSRRRSAGRSREDENPSDLTESTYSVEDKTTNDEPTNATRSTRGRRARTSMKDAVNEKMKKEGMPTRRSRTPARESLEQRQKTPKKEEKPSPKESTATKTSVVREVSEDGAAFTILDSVEDKVEDDQPAAGLTEGRETPKKEDETTEKDNETLKKAEKDESEKVAEEGEAAYEVLDSVEDKTIDGQHPAVLSESSGKEDISSKDDEQTQGEVMESASKTDVKNENTSAPKPQSDAETLEVENKQESCKKNDTPSTLENLDEVSDEEEDYPDDTAAEEKLGMKRTATKEKIIAKEQETRRTRAREDRRTKEREERERMERRTKEREEREDRKIREREERERMDWRTKEREERWREDRKSRRTRERDEREREDRRSRRTRERDEREQRSRSSSRGGEGGGSSGPTVKDKDEETVEVDPSELVTLDELEADEVMSDEGIREEDLLALVTLDEYIEEEEEEEGGQAEQSTLETSLLLQESEAVTFVTLDGADGSDVEKKPDGEQAEETSGSAKSKHDDDTVNVAVGEEDEKEKEEEKEEVTTRTRSQAKKRTRQTPAVRKPRGATAGPEAKRPRS